MKTFARLLLPLLCLIASLVGAEAPPPKERLLFEAKPISREAGFRMDGWWIWDPSLVRGSDGKWHLFASRWPKNLPMHPGWLLGSEVIRAESDRPEGPFRFKETVFPARGPAWWDGRITHNPRVYPYVQGGITRFAMFYMGSTHPFPEVGTNETVAMNDPRVIVARANKRIGLALADDPRGPWIRRDRPTLSPRPGRFDDFFASNPAAVFRKDGSIYLMYKSRPYQSKEKGYVHGSMTIGAARASNLDAPFVALVDEPLFSTERFGEIEDPFVWEEGGVLRLIAKDQRGTIGGTARAGISATSVDGVKWKLADPLHAWSLRLAYDDGSSELMAHFERPFVLFQDGRATHLLGAVADGEGGFKAKNTWITILPLARP